MPIHATPVILVETVAMRGYHSASYGDAFADVYDDWYGEVSDVAVTVALVVALAGPAGRVLELGVGTGRLALPIASAGLHVTGIDASSKMLEQLARNDPEATVVAVAGDMVDDLPIGRFDVVLAAYNTVFNLLTADRQLALFREVALRLAPGASFVVEAFVPRSHHPDSGGSHVSVRSMTTDRVVLSASIHDTTTNRIDGQFIEITETGGIRLRPWAVRSATPGELDGFATQCGLVVDARWADVAGTPFDESSERHVTVYRLAGDPPRTAQSPT